MREYLVVSVGIRQFGSFDVEGFASWASLDDAFADGWAVRRVLGVAERRVILLLSRTGPEEKLPC